MKTLATILLSIVTILGCSSTNNENISNINKTDTCFSKTNFDIVYKYIDDQIKNGSNSFYKYGGYELYLTDTTTIAFKKDGYTLAKIAKEKGGISLAKNQKDNDKILKYTHQIFCDILSEIKK